MPRKRRPVCPTVAAIWCGRKAVTSRVFTGSRAITVAIVAVCYSCGSVSSISESLIALTSHLESPLTRVKSGRAGHRVHVFGGEKSHVVHRRPLGRSSLCPVAGGISRIRRSGKKAISLRPVRRVRVGFGNAASITGRAGSSEEMPLLTVARLSVFSLALAPSIRGVTRGTAATLYCSCM